jgi:hypothetical protein
MRGFLFYNSFKRTGFIKIGILELCAITSDQVQNLGIKQKDWII